MDTLIGLYPTLKALWVVWFFLIFIGMLVWVMRPSAKDRYRAMGEIPLNDDQRHAKR